MRTKGISPIEQHAEKIVLGIVACAAVGALVMQFMGGRATVKVGTRQEPVATAFRPVEEAARLLQSRIDSDSVKPPDPPAFTLGERLKFGPNAQGYSGPRVAMGPGPAITLAAPDAAVASSTYELPVVPAPSAPLGVAYSASIHPSERILHPDLGAILPNEQPYDLMAVSLEFTFDGSALRAALERDPDGPAEPIPMGWWRDMTSDFGGDLVTIVGVEVQRELVSAPEGVEPPGERTQILPSLPGRADGKQIWTETVRSAGDIPLGLNSLRAISGEIMRPEFYATIEGPKWEPPSVFLAKGDPAERRRQVDSLWRRWNDVQRRIATLEEQLKNAPAAERPPRDQPQPTQPAPGRGKGGPGATPGATQPRTGTPETRTGDRAVIERNLKQAREQLDDVSRRLVALGETVQGYESTEGMSAVSTDEAAPLLENPALTLWAHDVTGIPGATYRYRARVVINNPLFDRNLQEGPQRDLGKNSLLVGAWSEWSAPITVDPKQKFFVTSAEDRSAVIPMPHASVEVFQFYYGYYRVARATLEPGDVVADSVKLPELRFADLAKLEELVKRPGASAVPQPPVQPGREPAGPRGVPSPGPGPAPGRIAPPPPTPGSGTPAGEEGTQIRWPDWMSIEAPRSITLSVDAVFLGITSVPSDAGTPRNQAVLRLSNGTLLAVRPEDDRNSPLYRRLDGLARIGLTQGREPARVVEPPRPLPVRREQRRPGESGGGGGGGGGG
jgi:hypothetical protein